MQKESLHEPFSISVKTLDQCPKSAHQHSFFELVYIMAGTGKQCINQSSFRYREGHLFLLTPEDCHAFEVETTTTFFFLRFNNIYIKKAAALPENVERLEYILQNANHRPGCILKNQTDKLLVKPMVEAIIRESEERDIYQQTLIHQLVNTLIVVVARNIAKYSELHLREQTETRAMDILHYIQSHIYEPEKLKAENVSAVFNISGTYLGRYFKSHTNETMQQYIASYKTRLIEHRLQYSDKRINEISAEFNFTDESHFTKFFKKQKGIGPRSYRERLRSAPVNA